MNVIFNLLNGSGSPADSAVQPKGFFQTYGAWILIGVVIVGLFVYNYFARKKQQKAIEEKMSSIKSGDKIKTIGLICGTVVSVDDVQNTVVIATGDEDHQSFLTIDKSAIYQIFPAGSGVNGVTQVNDETENNAVNGESENSDAEIDELAENEKDDENKENE